MIRRATICIAAAFAAGSALAAPGADDHKGKHGDGTHHAAKSQDKPQHQATHHTKVHDDTAAGEKAHGGKAHGDKAAAASGHHEGGDHAPDSQTTGQQDWGTFRPH